ncbi:MAG: VWA domain-containing protein [Candidatus Rokubacteria bacterium]|nr:VWA domain-containing protein [Candidatus Rokubacteria bacterium]
MARDLLTSTLSFCRLLRQHGMPVTVTEATDAVRALEHLDLADRDEVYLGLRSVLMARIEEQPAFDRCFEAFWKRQSEFPPIMEGLLSLTPASPRDDQSQPATLKVAGQKREGVALEAWVGEDDESDSEPLGVPGMSDRESLMEQDFSSFPADQLDEVARLTVEIARRLAAHRSRRRRPTRRRGVIDLRRTVRANLMRGELIELRQKERKRRKVRLVLLCDISGSMDLYSRFLLLFLYALQNVFGRVETFSFSTRLTRITPHLMGPGRLQPRMGGAAARPSHDRPGYLRRLGHGGSGALGRRAAHDQAPGRAALLAESAARQSRLPAADARHGGGAPHAGPLRPRPQPPEPPRPRDPAAPLTADFSLDEGVSGS